MFVIYARNPMEALAKGINTIAQYGEVIESRNGPTLELPQPCATVYSKPWERVLISSLRDANPFFHLMEAIWILAGRYDVKFLNEFNKRMVDYSDDGVEFNAPYGYRMRDNVSDGQFHYPKPFDQIAHIINILRKDPQSRQAVAQIWDVDDLTKDTKDKACNMSAVFRIRNGKLCLTVYNRSNDMIWGAYGANVVQFSMLQEYVAAHLGLPLGEYTQVTNSYHVYTSGPGGELWQKLSDEYQYFPGLDPYDTSVYNSVYMNPYDMQSGNFDHDLKLFFNAYDTYGLKEIGEITSWKSKYFKELILPVLCVFLIHKQHGAKEALGYAGSIEDDAWKLACVDWLTKRIK